jgi:hypothetical protein
MRRRDDAGFPEMFTSRASVFILDEEHELARKQIKGIGCPSAFSGCCWLE